MLPGSGAGGAYNTSVAIGSAHGGHGGGLVRIQASGSVTINGTVTANGAKASDGAAMLTSGANEVSGGGAGGSIYIRCAALAPGAAGSLSVAGGTYTDSRAGGGGAGELPLEGVSDVLMSQYLGVHKQLIRSSTNAHFVGTISVTNGASYTTDATDRHRVVFHVPVRAGTIMFMR